MIKPFLKAVLTIFIFLILQFCYGQGYSPVSWQFKAEPVTGHETLLSITATLDPGWHLYSQFIKEGGPIPTRFRFEPGDGYVPVSPMDERGKEARFYDDLYEMDIIWYSDVVTFSQRIRLVHPETIIKGKVEFMTCNDEVCIPGEREFMIEVNP